MNRNRILISVFFLLFCIPVFAQAQTSLCLKQAIDALNKDQIKSFNSLDYPEKNNNISLTISYPNTFTFKDGKRPHILRQYTSPVDENGYVIVSNIQINKNPSELNSFSESEIADILFSDEVTEQSLPNAKIIYSKRTKYEGQPGQILIYTQQVERSGMSMNSMTCIQRLIYKNYVVTINTIYSCTKPGITLQDFEKHSQAFLLFNSLLGNSLILNKY